MDRNQLNITRSEAISTLMEEITRDLDKGFIRDILLEGWTGYNNLSNYELECELTDQGFVNSIEDVSVYND